VLSRSTPSPWPRRPERNSSSSSSSPRPPAVPHDESRPSPSMKRLWEEPAAALAGGLDSHSNAAKHSHRTAQPSLSGCAGSS